MYRLLKYVFILIFFSFYNANALYVIKDSEIESVINEIANPLIKAANLQNDVKIIIINSKDINAFAVPGNRIFINHGIILKSHSLDMIAGVLAHELGHIKSGHFLTRKQEYQNQAFLQAAVFLLGLGGSIMTASPEAMWAVTLKGHDALEKMKYSFTRDQEVAADMAAVGFLKKSHYDVKGLVDLLKLTSHLDRIYNDLYSRTHPFSNDRINLIRAHISTDKQHSNNLNQRFLLARAKLEAYMAENKGAKLLRKIERNKDILSRYQKAIIYYRKFNLERALKEIDFLIENYKHVYFHELKAEILFEQKNVAKALEEVDKLLNYKINDPLLLTQASVMYINAYEKNGNRVHLDKAINLLDKSNYIDETYLNYQQLARAYGLLGKTPLVDYNLALGFYLIEEKDKAKRFAEHALDSKKLNEKQQIKMKDLIKFIENKK